MRSILTIALACSLVSVARASAQEDAPDLPRASPPTAAPPAPPVQPPPGAQTMPQQPPPGYPPYYYYPPPPPGWVPPRQPIRYEERPRYGLLIAGAAVLGGTYLLSVTFTAMADSCGFSNCNNDWPMYIPLLGPFLEIGRLSSGDSGLSVLLVMDGLAQVGGLVMMIAGGLTHHKVAVYADRVNVLPWATATGGGLLVSSRF